MSTHAMEKVCSISICELRMPKLCHAKKSTFGNLDSLTDHQIQRIKAINILHIELAKQR
jgi:hypothetical protein